MQIDKNTIKNTLIELKEKQTDQMKMIDALIMMGDTNIAEDNYLNIFRGLIYDMGVTDIQIYQELFNVLGLKTQEEPTQETELEIEPERIPEKTVKEEVKEQTQEEIENEIKEHKRRLVQEAEEYESTKKQDASEDKQGMSVMDRLKALRK